MRYIASIIVLAAWPALGADVSRAADLLKARDYKGAEAQARAAVQENGDDARAHQVLGMALLKGGKTEEAASELKRSAELKPDDADTHLGLASAMIESKRFDEAQSHIGEAEKLSGDNPGLAYNRGALLAAQRKWAESIPELEKAVAANPEDAMAHYYLGLAYSNTKRPDKMLSEFQTFLRLEPNSPNAAKVRSFMRAVR